MLSSYVEKREEQTTLRTDTVCLVGILLLGSVGPSLSQLRQSGNGDYIESVNGIRFVMKSIPGGAHEAGFDTEDNSSEFQDWIGSAQLRVQRQVTIDPFYMAETETTWDLYQQCINAGGCTNNESDGGDNGWGKGDRPVIEVSWNDITQEFLPWLNSVTGRGYRLPTEAEWEHAARAGASTRYSWGNEIDCTRARYGYASKECGSQSSTDPVKSYPPNSFGLYDMHGNVWEYMEDCWLDGAEHVAAALLLDGRCEEKVLKGGSWLNEPQELRFSMRFRHARTYRESGDGFRVAHSMDR